MLPWSPAMFINRPYAHEHPPNSFLKIALLDTALFTILGISCILYAPVIATKTAKGEYYKTPPRVSRRKHCLRHLEEGGMGKKWSLGSKKVVRVEGQEESLWFRLPYEVRRMVYGYVFSEGGVVDVEFDARYKLVGRARADERAGQFGVLGLVGSCRRVYIETSPLLYTLPTYRFMNPIAFLVFSATITPHAFHSLQGVFLDFSEVPYLSSKVHRRWPEPPPKVTGMCVKKVVPVDGSSLLERPKNYRNFRLSRVKKYFNPLVFKAGGRSVMKRRKATQSIWQWTCDVLGQMQGLRTLEIKIRQCFKVWIEEHKLDQIFGSARIAAESQTGLQSFVVRIYGYDDWGCELPGELERWRKALSENGGNWTEVPRSLWERNYDGLEDEGEQV